MANRIFVIRNVDTQHALDRSFGNDGGGVQPWQLVAILDPHKVLLGYVKPPQSGRAIGSWQIRRVCVIEIATPIWGRRATMAACRHPRPSQGPPGLRQTSPIWPRNRLVADTPSLRNRDRHSDLGEACNHGSLSPSSTLTRSSWATSNLPNLAAQ